MNSVDIVKQYVHLSNLGQIEDIALLLDDNAIYTSDNVGIHFRKENLLQMKRRFFSNLREQHWEVSRYDEVKPNIIEFEFRLSARTINGEVIDKPGVETVVVSDNGKIIFIAVKNT